MNPFDGCWDWDGDAESGGRSNSHTQKIPAGTHTGDVVKASFECRKFAVDKSTNPDGECLTVTWSKDGYYPIVVRVPKHWRGLTEAICRGCGIATPQRGVAWSERDLVGRTATVDVEYKVDNEGKEWARITRWHASPIKPLPAAVANRPAPARSQVQKAAKEFTEGQDDSIPF